MDNKVPKFSAADPVECIEALIRYYRSFVCLDAYALIGNMQDADEVANDTFIRVFKVLQDQPELEIRSPKVWLRTFLRYAVLDFKRKRARSLKGYAEISYTQLEQTSDSEWQELLETLVDNDWRTLPEAAVLSKEGVATIVNKISQLPNPQMREALYLSLRGLSLKEIAERLNQLENTLKSNISRGKNSVRTTLNIQDER